MARLIGCDQNTMLIKDNLSDTVFAMGYTMPTTKQRQRYSNMSYKRKGRKVENCLHEARLWGGLEILTSIREGDWEHLVNGKPTPFSSDPKSENYIDIWKDLVEHGGADILMLLGARVFEGSVEVPAPEEDEAEEQEDQSQD